jgi:lauroyl/myristoyl acyltransferase
MNEKSTLYKAQIKKLEKQYHNLKIYGDDNLTRQFHIVSAGLLNYLPDIPYIRHEEIFKNILLHQKLSMVEQDAEYLLNNIQVKNFMDDKVQLLKNCPAVICTFHIGSYRLINLLLAKYCIPFSLIISQKVLQDQGTMFKNIFSLSCTENADSFNLINAESPGSALSMFRELKKGKNLVIYMDGNTGAGKRTNQNENSCLISLLNQQIMARKGVGFLSHAANVPILPVICFRDSIEEITLHFFDMIYPDTKEERNLYAEKITQKIYDMISPFILRYPEQWEAWLYLHKVAHIIKSLATITVSPHESLIDTLRFNMIQFGLFRISQNNYIFNKSNYVSYPVNNSIYSLLTKAINEPVNKGSFDVNLFNELYKNRVLIHE